MNVYACTIHPLDNHNRITGPHRAPVMEQARYVRAKRKLR